MAEAPELAVAAKRINTLENDIANLRRGMVAQLTSSGKLLKAVMSIDGDYFGGRFGHEAESEVPSPQRDVTTALAVVEAIAEELQGASAFADSPLLRDEIASLISAVESLRTAALDADRFAGEVVGLPSRGDVLPARVFPDNNPLACLKETAGFARDLQGLIGRIRDRIAAANMMLTEADKARSDAEQALAEASPQNVAEKVTAELQSRDAELTAMRVQALAAQEQSAAELKQARTSLEGKLHTLQEALQREADLRRSDAAETRSLAAEIERLAGADPDTATSDDLEITLGVLREAIGEGHGASIDGLASAAEGVLIGWSRMVGERTASAAKELSTLRWQLGEAETKARQTAEHSRAATAAHQRSHSEVTAAGTARSEAARDVEAIRARLSEAEAKLGQRDDSLKIRDEAVKRLEETANRLREEHARELRGLAQERDVLAEHLRTAASGAVVGNRDQEDAVTRAQAGATAAEAQLDEARKAAAVAARSVAEVRSEADRLSDELGKAQGQLAAALSRANALEEERNRLAVERDELVQRADKARRERDDAEAAIHSATERTSRDVEQSRTAERALRDETTRLSDLAAAAEAERHRFEQDLQKIREERDRAVGELDRQRAQAEVDRRRSADLSGERGLIQERLDTAETKTRELTKELDLVKTAAIEAEGRSGRLDTDVARLQTELERLKAQVTAASEARVQATAEANDKARAALTAASERDAARALSAEAQTERQRAAAALERVQAEALVAARRAADHESELNIRLADQARQLAEFKLAATTAGAETQRLKAELERLSSARDQAKSDERETARRIGEVARQADEARARAATADGQLSGQKRLIAELEGQLAEARAQIGRLEEGQSGLEAIAAQVDRDKQMQQAERDRNAGLARTWAQQRTEIENLLREARLAVVNAKESIQRVNADNRMVVESLQNELSALKAKTTT